MCIKDTFITGLRAEDPPCNHSTTQDAYQYMRYINCVYIITTVIKYIRRRCPDNIQTSPIL